MRSCKFNSACYWFSALINITVILKVGLVLYAVMRPFVTPEKFVDFTEDSAHQEDKVFISMSSSKALQMSRPTQVSLNKNWLHETTTLHVTLRAWGCVHLKKKRHLVSVWSALSSYWNTDNTAALRCNEHAKTVHICCFI